WSARKDTDAAFGQAGDDKKVFGTFNEPGDRPVGARRILQGLQYVAVLIEMENEAIRSRRRAQCRWQSCQHLAQKRITRKSIHRRGAGACQSKPKCTVIGTADICRQAGEISDQRLDLTRPFAFKP